MERTTTFNDISTMLDPKHTKFTREVLEKVFWLMVPHHESGKAVKKLAEAFNLPMPTGVCAWDDKLRLVCINDEFEDYKARDPDKVNRAVHKWLGYINKRGWHWACLRRSAKDGGTVLMFQLPYPRKDVPVPVEIEKAMEPITGEVQEEPEEVEEPIMKPVKSKKYTKKAVRNMKRKKHQPVELEDDE